MPIKPTSHSIRHYHQQIHHAVSKHINHFVKDLQKTIHYLGLATLRFLLITIPLHKLSLINRLSKRELDKNHAAIRLAQHIDLSTKEGRAVAEFSVYPRPAFALNPVDSKQLAKAKALKDRFSELSHNPVLTEKEKDTLHAKIEKFEKLLKLTENKWATLQDFTRDEFEAYDEVNFELTREHFQNLAVVFASAQFEQSQKELVKWGVNLAEAMVAEALAKSLAYSEGNGGKEMEIPVKDEKTGIIEMVRYKITDFNFGKALPGYILTPISNPNAPTWVVARGTQPMLKKDANKIELRKGARESIKADLHPESMTRDAVYQALKHVPALKRLFKQNGPANLKFAGHSLGGALVTDLATRNQDAVKKVYTFSPPSSGPIEAARWSDTLNDKVVAFDVLGDIVPSACLHVKGLHLEIAQDEKKHPISAHNEITLNKPFTAAIIDNKKESERQSRQLIAKLQRNIFKP